MFALYHQKLIISTWSIAVKISDINSISLWGSLSFLWDIIITQKELVDKMSLMLNNDYKLCRKKLCKMAQYPSFNFQVLIWGNIMHQTSHSLLRIGVGECGERLKCDKFLTFIPYILETRLRHDMSAASKRQVQPTC